MLDRATEELISAYLDGELSRDERELVERQLNQLDEHRQYYQELLKLRSRIQQLPTVAPPSDFADRVLGQIAQQERPTVPATPAANPRKKKGPWVQIALALASLAAVVLALVFWGEPSRPPARQTPVTQAALPPFLVQQPQYLLLYDVSLTPRGAELETLERLLQRLGVTLDPNFKLDARLEADLLAVREAEAGKENLGLIPYKKARGPVAGRGGKVELIYLAGQLAIIDQFGQQLEQLKAGGVEVADMHYDLVLQPQKLALLRRLHNSAAEHFAAKGEAAGERPGHAFKLVLNTRLSSAAVPGLASIAVPQLTPRLAPVDSDRSTNGPPPEAPAPDGERMAAPDVAQQPFAAAQGVGYVLLIARYPTN